MQPKRRTEFEFGPPFFYHFVAEAIVVPIIKIVSIGRSDEMQQIARSHGAEGIQFYGICCALVFKDKAVAGKEKQLKALLSAYRADGKKLSNPKTALATARTLLTQPAPVLKQSLKWISYSNLSITEHDYAVLAGKVKEYGIISNPPSYKEFVKWNQQSAPYCHLS